MKKSIAFSAVLLMLTFCGCSSDADRETGIIENSVTEEITSSAVSESESEVPTETVIETQTISETKTVPGLSAEDAYADKNGSSWTDELMNKTKSWDKGNIIFKAYAEEDGNYTDIEMSSYDGSVYVNMEVSGLMTVTMMITGDKCYMIDRKTKSYCIENEDVYDGESEMDSLLDTDEDYSSFLEDGIENIDGENYIYEKYNVDGGECIFYYTPDGKLCKMRTDGNVMNFTISLLEEPDETYFTIPGDYMEISSEEMAQAVMSGFYDDVSSAESE